MTVGLSARGDLRNHPFVGRVLSDLAQHDVRQDARLAILRTYRDRACAFAVTAPFTTTGSPS